MIIRPETAAKLLGYNDGENIELIELLVPIVQDKIIDYCNNSFIVWDVYLSDELTFTATANTISGDFPTAGFKIKDNIKVKDSDYNDGYCEIKEISSTGVKVDKDLTTETTSVYINKVKFPESIKLEAVQLIRYYLTNQGKLVKSESTPGGYSVTFKDESEIMKIFNQYRKPFK